MTEYSDIAEKKILILYFLKIIEIPIGSMQFVRIMQENRLMNYFYMQQYLSELIEEGLVTVDKKEGISYYTITDKGLWVLNMFESILPAGLKKLLKDSISEIKNRIHAETMITADYYPEGDGYTVVCKIRENDFSLIEIKLAAGTKEDARNICKNWTEFPQEIYVEILDAIIKNREKSSPPAGFTDDQKERT
ncbi:hypothetical protein Cst_c07670 [Thermoclostridium stercorarium subsp. stercorarium DSM 8532]|jgi:predicted transcriptional regulator|uniref:DUF4364 domain-containing protein n=3 Tax=Thermoclostridium stercorarium TaxID=1510 RepID=L7VMS9_THES1|nr:DUF4364 family protein [Thermoclostridium stercorarium]AGC67771.1 hypothetical protein Cst_c07670 [Thermoclostridium stercorarium subsp. stercorarium DSM 8532]AGI38814.1 hypothetical protein Clst_0729 [Thermoclostridium stercorarium subsp. stercorarium DSM 8532]ANW98177.1 hypothetical protein CSTERTH_03540 [Thermoclostridium stercorarium subsp. thermolacticum DSM 2910]ANX00718.1 hypothetical protein CSTERLE_03505 [Thermoclostridium stercorarium subsp. leptospartum DSM 9219]UZQ86335.1 DUF436